MIVLRTILIAIVFAGMLLVPVLSPSTGTGRSVSAAPPETSALKRHHGNNNNGNGNWNGNNNNGNWNENWNHNGNNNNGNHNANNNNGNGNGNGNDNDDNNNNGNDNHDNHNDNGRRHRGPHEPGPLPPPPPPPPVASDCFGAGASGSISLTLDGGTIALTVVPASAFPAASRISLAKVDPASAPASPGSRLDAIVFEVRAQDGCDGSNLANLPADVNLGLTYSVQANKSALTFAAWDGSRWTDLPTVADPNASNPYVSTTIRSTGLVTVYQRT